ncbi:hypothetical protein ILUMI_01700, partial [Ignelater luminosus]
VPCLVRMVTEGLPTFRRERGVHQDIIAGADFLSVLMESPAVRQAYRELSTTTQPTTTFRTTLQIPSNSLSEYLESNTPVIREQRSSRSTTAVEPHAFTQTPNEFGANNTTFLNVSDDKTIINKVNFTKHSSDNIRSNGSLIISVLVSSSEGDSHINKIPHDSKSSTELRTVVETTSELTTLIDQTVISSEDHPSILAESSKSEFSVDEREPITSNGENFDEYTQEYPANVQPLPSPQTSSSKETLQHHSVIYHDNPNEPVRGRSVSYSAVIQTLPKQPIVRTWANENSEHKERQERHYELGDSANDNQFEKNDEKYKNENANKENSSSSVAESSNYFVTSKYESSSNYRDDTPTEQKETSWEKPEQAYVSSESSLKKHSEPTEKNWEIAEKNHGQQEKPYSPTVRTEKQQTIPVVYGKPEQNYEVDEAVSVMTNGRTHGVQPLNKLQRTTPTVEIRTDQANDSQKVGYVVEGRNYRKYRVEERTSDGFIVGEYGVVSHDNGALRGVRYTADGTVNPRLIYDALMKFLSL